MIGKACDCAASRFNVVVNIHWILYFMYVFKYFSSIVTMSGTTVRSWSARERSTGPRPACGVITHTCGTSSATSRSPSPSRPTGWQIVPSETGRQSRADQINKCFSTLGKLTFAINIHYQRKDWFLQFYWLVNYFRYLVSCFTHSWRRGYGCVFVSV